MREHCWHLLSILPKTSNDRADRRWDVPITTGLLLCGGATAGGLAQTVVYPLDLLRRRMQVAGMEGEASRSVVADSTWLALRRVVKDGGGRGLFAGIVPTYMKVMPATAIGAPLPITATIGAL